MGVHPPEAMMHFPSLFQISPHIFEKFSDSEENFQNFTFSRKISRFSSEKISDDLFLVINHKFRVPPIFPVSVHFHPVSRKLLFFPLLLKIPPCFRKIHLLFTYFTCISFPNTLTVMHLCITQCTYWTPLRADKNWQATLYRPRLPFLGL